MEIIFRADLIARKVVYIRRSALTLEDNEVDEWKRTVKYFVSLPIYTRDLQCLLEGKQYILQSTFIGYSDFHQDSLTAEQ